MGTHTLYAAVDRHRRAWRAGVWLVAAADLALLARTSWAFVGFFIVFPLLWMAYAYDSLRAAVQANLVFATGIAIVGAVYHDVSWLATAAVSVAFSLWTGLWVNRMHEARSRAERAVADKQTALEELARVQAGLARAERAAGVAAEHDRWAREVHDTLAQSFVSIIALTQASRADAEAGASPDLCRRLEQVETVAREGLAEARALVAGEQPTALREGGPAQALARLWTRCRERGLEMSVDDALPDGMLDALPPARQVIVLRVAQEALGNVVRHARAERARVALAVEDLGAGRELAITVSDDGVGMSGAPEGTGLTGMRTRLEQVGGTLTVDPAHRPDAAGRTGTVLEARMPL